ncbi:hypothetical protein KNU91_gp068 [Enterococcus phage nattely]|uniref:Uncharacterized protein n=1 Tax=Enterococcus phage nattely TaxID=2719593 RepID=A0A6G9LKS9_9CAUD|nr:hypothetical protein KNU91_gp068 [Enterococcus phage nattely]QIQ66235.1 hypothetical protein nattely_68 [Enterococcus phage nattely]
MSYYDYIHKQEEIDRMVDQLQLLDLTIGWSTDNKDLGYATLIIESGDFRMCFNVDYFAYMGKDLKSTEDRTKIIDYSINKFKRAYVQYKYNLKEIGEINHVI